MTLIIEICPSEPRAMFCNVDDENRQDVSDCTGSGDAQPACEYIRDAIGVEIRIVARNAQGEYENRLATDSEIEATARAIYFDSESDFSDIDLAKTYLIWDAANTEESLVEC